MSATAFQRARREAAAKMAVAETAAFTGFESMTVEELKELCQTKGIEFKARATKKELIELLGK